MLLMIHWYTKANYKYMKNYDKNKKSSYIQQMQAICVDGKCLENCLWMVLNGKKYVSI